MGDSEKDTNNEQENSVDSKNHKGNTDKTQEYRSSNNNNSDDKEHEKSSDTEEISEFKTPKNLESPSKQESTENSDDNKNNSIKDDSFNEHAEDEENAYHYPVQVEHNFIKLLKTNRDKIIKGFAIVVGGFLILYGLVLVSASVTNVASNVIFGEDATADAFLILLGVLIIVAAFAQSIMDRTPISKIGSELEVNEESSESDENSKKVKENDNKVSDDNKDNILGENKR